LGGDDVDQKDFLLKILRAHMMKNKSLKDDLLSAIIRIKSS
jgi:hypothetical protein